MYEFGFGLALSLRGHASRGFCTTVAVKLLHRWNPCFRPTGEVPVSARSPFVDTYANWVLRFYNLSFFS